MEFSLGSKGFKPHMGHWPPARGLHWEDKLSQCPALKISGAHLQESQRAIGNRDSAFKGLAHKLTHSKTQHRSRGFKSA